MSFRDVINYYFPLKSLLKFLLTLITYFKQ
jgi:hypothetical protein